jgi:hypothetical protein
LQNLLMDYCHFGYITKLTKTFVRRWFVLVSTIKT